MAHMIVGSIIGGIICCMGWIGIYNLIYDKIVHYSTPHLFLVTAFTILIVLRAIAYAIGIETQYTIVFIVIGGISTIVTFYILLALFFRSSLPNSDLLCQ